LSGLAKTSLLVWPTVTTPLTGAAIEDVVLGVDEDSNLLWAVEGRVGGVALPTPPRTRASNQLSADRPVDATRRKRYRYAPTTEIFPFWHPYQIEEIEGRRRFVQGRLADLTVNPPRLAPEPRARVLTDATAVRPAPAHQIEPATIPTLGLRLERRSVLARGTDGMPVLWTQRRRLPLLAPPAPRLRFDIFEEDDLPLFASEVLADSPIAYYRLNEAPGTPGTTRAADWSGHENHGAVSPTGITFGVNGLGSDDTAARFDGLGIGRIIVSDHESINPKRLTIEALISWSGPVRDIQQRILEKSLNARGELAGYGLSVLPDGHLQAEIALGPNRTILEPFLKSTEALTPHVPTHVAATYDGTTLAIYVQGRLDTVQSATGDLSSTLSISDLGIGNQAEHEPPRIRTFNGIIDEVALYDKALSADRIRAHVSALVARPV
jgi:hypothetical protein